jgi:iron complex outermembrane receptor protein
MKLPRLALVSVTMLAGVATALPAVAQQASTSALEEVVVTAQRRSEALETVPMSVTPLAPEVIEHGGVVGLETIGRVAAGVQLNFSGAFIQPAIRGITTLTNGNNIENNVAVYVDGIYNPSTVSIASDLANVESVQVLKGPQGTLYGRNATGGAILINTLGPSKTFTGKFEAGYGSYSDTTFSAFLAGPISDGLRFSLAGNYRYTPGYFKKVSPTTIGEYIGDVGKMEQKGLTAKLEYDLTSNLTATLSYKYAFNQDDRVNYYSVYGHINTAILPPPPSRATVYGTVAFYGPTYQFANRNEGDLKVVWKTGIGTLTSLTAYDFEHQQSAFDFASTYRATDALTQITFGQRTYQTSLDYAIDAIQHLDLLVGAFYYNDTIATPDAPYEGIVGSIGGTTLTSIGKLDQRTRSAAAYVDATYHLTDRWSLNAGGRFTHDYKSMNSVTRSPTGAVLPSGGPFIDDHTWNRFTPRVSVRYELAERTNVYASWSQGYRNGNYNASGNGPGVPYAPTAPETVDAFELGFKTAQSSFQFNTAAFYYDYKDINVNISVPAPVCPTPGACGNISQFANAPGADIYGLDAEFTWTPVRNLNVRTGAEWLHARYKTFPNAVGTGVNAANTLNVANQVQNWSGQQLARAPNGSANLGIDYTVPTSLGSLLFATNVNYTSSFAVNNVSLYGPLAPAALQNEQRFRQDAYTLVSADITWTAPSQHYYVQVYGRNLSNVTYRLNYNGAVFGDYSPRGEPLTYGGRIGVRF